MADESVYASSGGEPNKRKYEDSPPPVARRSTGFSSAPGSAAPAPAYNSVPPPMSEIEVAKQKAQEIAARLLSNSDPSKRARVENGAGVGGGYDAVDSGISQKYSGMGQSGPPQSASYGGYPGPSKKIEIPNGRVGVIIGKGGETIKYLQLQSGAKIQVTRDMDADPNSTTRGVEITGTPDQIAKAEQLINDVLSEADSGGSGTIARRVTGQPSGGEQFVMMIPNNKVGLVIGKGGETIKSMQAATGARIQVIPLHLPPGDMSKERTVQIDGSSEQIEAAKQLVEEAISENRMRNQSSQSGGYNQQGYQARPPTNWAPPGPPPMQQPGYGYVQPGAYPGPPQYNQPPYSGYPPQPTTGGYAATWDQSTAQNQQAAQGGGSYDYYNQQQQQQQAPTDGSSYGYGQAPAYSQGQGYTQDGYGGYTAATAQSGYAQPQSNPGAGYEQQQQQQGYSNPTYGNAPNPTPDEQTPATHTDTNQTTAPGQSYNASYGAQKPSAQPAYAQPQQSPGGYSQPGYLYSQPPPSSGYPTSQAGGYGAGQPGYGQQQQPYNSAAAYGGAYSQPPPYSTDVTPPPNGATAKASPPS